MRAHTFVWRVSKSPSGSRSLRLGAHLRLEGDHHDPVSPTVDRPTETLSSGRVDVVAGSIGWMLFEVAV
jgi:hypothetical protein